MRVLIAEDDRISRRLLQRRRFQVKLDCSKPAVALHQQSDRRGGRPGPLAELGLVGEVATGDLVDVVADLEPGASGRRAGNHVGENDGPRFGVVAAPGDAQPQGSLGQLHLEAERLLLPGAAHDQRDGILGRRDGPEQLVAGSGGRYSFRWARCSCGTGPGR